jgi:hypothetical protein
MAVAGDRPHVVEGEDGGFVGSDARQSKVAQCGAVGAVDVDEIGGGEFRHARDIEGAEKVDVVKPDRSCDAAQKFFDMRSTRHEHRVFLRSVPAEDAGFDAAGVEAIAQAVHLDLTAAGMAIAMMHEQDFHGAERRSTFEIGKGRDARATDQIKGDRCLAP